MAAQSVKLDDLTSGGKPAARRRLTSTEPIARHFLSPSLPGFLAENPHLSVELQLSTDNASFSRWETDLAIRLSRPDRGNIVIRKLASYEWLLLRPAKGDAVFGCGGLKQYMTEEEWSLQGSILHGLPTVTTNGMATAKSLLRTGKCIGFLPSYMCAEFLENPSIKVESISSERQVWLLTQEHLRDDPDTRLVADWIETAFKTAPKDRYG